MNLREKLVELLKNAKSAMKSENLSCDIARNMFVVDFMIANGVTVQEWISVDDRLPEPKHEFDARNWYLVALSNGVVKELAYEFHNHSVFGYGWRETAYPVTHWMELPQPPKGE